MSLKFFRQIFEKPSNTRFNQNPPTGNGIFPYGQTGRRTDETRRTLFAILWTRLKSLPMGGACSSGLRIFWARYWTWGSKKAAECHQQLWGYWFVAQISGPCSLVFLRNTYGQQLCPVTQLISPTYIHVHTYSHTRVAVFFWGGGGWRYATLPL
jgi:hypothetical protein